MMQSGEAARRLEGTRLAVVGDESLVVQCTDLALERGADVVVIATAHPDVAGWAHEREIQVVEFGSLADELRAHRVDVLLSIANERLLPAPVLDAVPVAVNFHDGPLPELGGVGATTWAIAGGRTEHGVSWHIITSGIDDGDVLVDDRFEITPDDTALSLNARCYEAAIATFPRVLDAIASEPISIARPGEPPDRVLGRYERPRSVIHADLELAEADRLVRSLAFGGRVRNRLGSPKLLLGDDIVVIDRPSSHADDDAAVVLGLGAGGLAIAEASTPEGRALDLAELAETIERIGAPVAATPDQLDRLDALDHELARHETFWVERLASIDLASLPGDGPHATAGWSAPISSPIPDGVDEADAVAAIAIWMAALTGTKRAAFSLVRPESFDRFEGWEPLVRAPIAVVDIERSDTFDAVRAGTRAELDEIDRRGWMLRDLVGRDPRLRGRTIEPAVSVTLGDQAWSPAHTASEPDLEIVLDAVGATVSLLSRAAAVSHELAETWLDQIVGTIGAATGAPSSDVASLRVRRGADAALLERINDTTRDVPGPPTIDAQFRSTVERFADRPAVSCGDRTLTYGELAEFVDHQAARLANVGVGRGDLVGIAQPRSIEMVVAVLATMTRGAAYVPLDPDYPIDRLRGMVEDSGLRVLVADGTPAAPLADLVDNVVDPSIARSGGDELTSSVAEHDRDDLAYVIYTSGSTGRPKGVMLEHGNVVNFFAAMDDEIDHDPPGVWLSVTSLSFDISVLELLWTLCRGFHVVVKSTRAGEVAAPGPSVARPTTGTAPSFSLFYFAAGSAAGDEDYRLLLDGARFADRHDFEAVWTPERHFHEFGGAYPNPSVAAAAIAGITDRIAIRAGSVVLPLHSPVRVAEEWALVDRLSGGRTGISFAAGWQRDDFVLAPDNYATARESLGEQIGVVHRLWAGDSVTMPGPDGIEVDVRTLPRPVQTELPTWLTSAGSRGTFERAGTLGFNLLTHLLGQSIEQLTGNIEAYRAARSAAGHDSPGRVTLMLHTFVDDDRDRARETAREPLKRYLGTATSLLKDMASAFPTFAGSGADADEAFRSLSDDEMSQLLDMATERYLGTSGMFGTPDDAFELALEVAGAGVDEIACLVDFGVPTQIALDSLELLDLVRRRVADEFDSHGKVIADDAGSVAPADDVATLVATHSVTHLQCTPSLAAMIVADPDDRAALASVQHLMVGGERLAASLADELHDAVGGRLTNMYGPTETTIWSLVHEVARPIGEPVPIGKPIANTAIDVLDPAGLPVPGGGFGELYIGGLGVARGYLHRPELTAERFVERHGGRWYATGDVVRLRPDGVVEFSGRVDDQVKIRGHRVELGEIEATIDALPGVERSVVVVSDGAGEPRLHAFVLPADGHEPIAADLARAVGDALPDVMVPAVFAPIDAWPTTPNGKIDRKALASRKPVAPSSGAVPVFEGSDNERLVASVWTELLDRPVGRTDNFFDLGGHSLLAITVFRRLQATTEATISLTDVFRYPTVATFAAHLSATNGAAPASTADAGPTGADRGEMRRRARLRGGS